MAGSTPGSLVIDLQVDGLAVHRQCHDNRAAGRREADGILQHVLEHDLEHAPAGTHDGAVVEAADEPDVLAGEDLPELKCRVANQLGEIGTHAGGLDEVGGADVVTLGGDYEVEQAAQRGIDDFEGAPGPLVVAGHRAGATGSSAERMAAIGVLKECALSSAD